MSAKLIDGRALSEEIRAEVAEGVKEVTRKLGRPPGLSVVLVGEDPASKIYVRNKERASKKLGMKGEVIRMPATSTHDEVLATVQELNAREDVDGILVQLPVPDQVDDEAIIDAIDPSKDVDGFHPHNLGLLMADRPFLMGCTPYGIMEMLRRYDVSIKGKNAVVVGRSLIVGKPMALMLLREHATVTICHSRTQDLAAEVRKADIVVAAVGRANLITADMVKPGAVVIDVGMNRLDDKLVGDVDFDAVKEVASLITPVPGGVGPMTITMLMKNTLVAASAKVK